MEMCVLILILLSIWWGQKSKIRPHERRLHSTNYGNIIVILWNWKNEKIEPISPDFPQSFQIQTSSSSRSLANKVLLTLDLRRDAAMARGVTSEKIISSFRCYGHEHLSVQPAPLARTTVSAITVLNGQWRWWLQHNEMTVAIYIITAHNWLYIVRNIHRRLLLAIGKSNNCGLKRANERPFHAQRS